MPNEIPAVFHNRSNWNVLGKIQKSTKFSVSTEKEFANIARDGHENVVTISYKIRFIDSARFMTSSLSNIADNLPEGIHKIKWKDCDCDKI